MHDCGTQHVDTHRNHNCRLRFCAPIQCDGQNLQHWQWLGSQSRPPTSMTGRESQNPVAAHRLARERHGARIQLQSGRRPRVDRRPRSRPVVLGNRSRYPHHPAGTRFRSGLMQLFIAQQLLRRVLLRARSLGDHGRSNALDASCVPWSDVTLLIFEFGRVGHGSEESTAQGSMRTIH